MTSFQGSAAWTALEAHHPKLVGLHMRDLFAAEPDRFSAFSMAPVDGLLLDYSKNRVTAETMALLAALAREAGVEEARDRMFAGEAVNPTENRAALHTALRAPTGAKIVTGGVDAVAAVRDVLARMRDFVEGVQGGSRLGHGGARITHVVNIGIGGSDLGPRLVVEAMAPFHQPNLEVRFVSNVDGADLAEALRGLDPASTLFVVASKTFTTQETMTNARSARDWLVAAMGEAAVGAHFAAVTANAAEAETFGVAPDAMFELWDWVGGRFSLWSAIGLPIALALGWERFAALLAGAEAMDRHFKSAPLEKNAPVILALLGIWYIDFFKAETHAIVPYAHDLRRLPAYLQQLDMESNGKSVDRDGGPIRRGTGPIVFGAPGTDGQHAFFQLLHQGPRLVPADFIVAAHSETRIGDHHDKLLANCLAQSAALMTGRPSDGATPPHRTLPGNRPTNTLMMARLEPFSLGALLALYEHKIFVQGTIWGINSFDQWGVELGKEICAAILPELQSGASSAEHDGSTAGLIARYRALTRGGA